MRFLLILTMTHIMLYASYTQTLAYYKAGKFSEAVSEAKGSKSSYSNPELHYLWGMSAEKLSRLNEAMAAYERVLLLDPNHAKAKKALYNLYAKTERYDLLAKNGVATPETKPSALRAAAAISGGYDSNLNATPDDSAVTGYFRDTVDLNKTASSFLRISALAEYTHNLGDRGGWYAKYGGKAFMQKNKDAARYDLATFSAEAGLGYNTENYNLYIPFSYHMIHYLEKNLFVQYRIDPTILIPRGKDNILNINASLSRNDYVQTIDQAKDDTSCAVEIGNYFLSGEDYISAHIKYEHRFADSSTPEKYIEADFLTLGIDKKYTFSSKISGTLGYKFRYGTYDDYVGTAHTRRDDNLHQIDAKVSYKASKGAEFFIGDTYLNNHSNHPAAVYHKNTIFMGMGLDF